MQHIPSRLWLALCSGALAACAQSPGPAPFAPPSQPVHTTAAAASSQPTRHNPPSAAAARALTQHHWQLRHIHGPHTSAALAHALATLDAPVQWQFDGQRLRIAGPCNRLHAPYQLSGQWLHIQALASTKVACADPQRMALESHLAHALTQAPRWHIAHSAPGQPLTLHLRWRDGSAWTLQSAEPLESDGQARAQPHTLFLEIAPHTQPCPPGHGQGACLRVREVRFDAQGIGHALGDWHTLAQPIEGFVHEPGMRSVLRVRHQSWPGGQAYVLDEAISAERTLR